MAKRKQAGRSGGGRGASKNGGGSGRTVAGFVAGAAVAVGGVLLYQHTQGRQRGGMALPESRTVRRTEDLPTPLAPGQRLTPGAGPAARPAGQGSGSAAGGAGTGGAGTGGFGSGGTGGGDKGAAGVATGAAGPGAAAQPPFGASEEVYETGARVYATQCAGCHGRPGRPAAVESGELAAGQFWGSGAKAIAAEPAGVIFRETAAGRPERQMPAYGQVLPETEIWDVALLLHGAGGELPEPVMRVLRGR